MIIITVLGWIFAAIIGIIFIPKAFQRVQENTEIKHKNNALNEEYARLTTDKNLLSQEIHEAEDTYDRLLNKISVMNDKVYTYYKDEKANMDARLAEDKERCKQMFEDAKLEYSQEYTSFIQDRAQRYAKETEELNRSLISNQQQLIVLKDKLEKASSIVESAVSANKRAAEISAKADFYKIIVTDEDKQEIEALRKCLSLLRNPEPLNKVIWKTYYEKPTSDLIGRVVGAGVHCGIYKITNINNGMCYVGQSVNIADRWKQHIKRGIGADTPTKNKLYPAMLAEGVENFSFEIIQECPSTELNEKEKFWTDYFKAQEFGYSIRKG